MPRNYAPAIAALASLLARDFYTLRASEVGARYFHALLQRRKQLVF